MQTPDVIVIGAAILDIPVGPVGPSVFSSGSHPVEQIQLNTGGDALNEATVLARLGRRPRLLTRIGRDLAGDLILRHCGENGIDTAWVTRSADISTGINLVLVSPDGERSFVTSERGSLRALRLQDLPLEALRGAKALCLASIFVSPHLQAPQLARIFREGRSQGLLVCADVTKRKQGETAADLAEAFRELDVLFANQEEAALLTGRDKPLEMARALLDAGPAHVVIKTGDDGCLVAGRDGCFHSPAYPGARCVDTTGAGDSFAAGFLHALLEGRELAECARFANATASLAVEAFGATDGVTGPDQVLRRLAQIPAVRPL